MRQAQRTHSPYTEFAKNRTDKNLNGKSGMPLQRQSGRLGGWAVQGEDIEGQESLGDEFEPFSVWPSERKSWRLCICHSGNPQEEADRKLEENHSGP